MAGPMSTGIMSADRKLVTLDLFTGIAGITHALQGVVAPAYYCDIDKYAHKVLASLMSKRLIPTAPIWTDVRTLGKEQLEGKNIDLILSSWPCVGFSNMGKREHFQEAGSGLFYQTMRLIDLTKPKAIFFENVPQVLQEMDEVRKQLVIKRKYQLRWCIIPAYSVGAPHCRDRWFCLATKPDFQLQASGLTFRHKIDWSQEPARTTNTIPAAEVNLRGFALGNAVVPACVRKAFFYLVSGGRSCDPYASKLQYHPIPLIRPCINEKKKLKFAFVDHKNNTLYPMEPMPIPPKPDLQLIFDSRLVAPPTQISYDQRHPSLVHQVKAAVWNTPRAGMTQAGSVLTERTIRDLPSQVKFERKTKNRLWPQNPEWVEWLMGFPTGWTKA